MKSAWPFFLLSLSFIVIWEFLSAQHILPRSLFPPPHETLKAFTENPDEWWQATIETASSSAIGLLISLSAGVLLAFALSLFSILKRAILPLAVFFQTVPIIAIAPLLVIYFGFGRPTVIASSAIVAFFPVLASFLLGLESVETEKLELFQLYGATPLQILMKLRLPASFLPLYSGLKVAVGLSIIGSIAGEFVAGGGLGALIDVARTQQRVDRVFAALLVLALIGILGLKLLKTVFYLIHKIRPFGGTSEEFA
jgi:NitT/TauT family transport system permease protein